MRNRLFREHEAKYCQEIEELRRNCREETNRARQARIDELSVHQERNPTTVSQLLTQIQVLQNKVNSLSDAGEFYDPETASSSGVTHVSIEPSTILSPRTLPRCDSGLPRDTQNGTGIAGNVFERLPAEEGQTSAFFNSSKNSASSFQDLRHDTRGNAKQPQIEMRREPQNSSILVPRFQRGAGMYDHTGGTYSHSGMIPISELHLGKFPDSMEFQSWKVDFKTEVCSKSADPHLAVSKKLRQQNQLTIL